MTIWARSSKVVRSRWGPMNVPAATSPRRCFSSCRATTGFREREDSRYCWLRIEYSIHQIENSFIWPVRLSRDRGRKIRPSPRACLLIGRRARSVAVGSRLWPRLPLAARRESPHTFIARGGDLTKGAFFTHRARSIAEHLRSTPLFQEAREASRVIERRLAGGLRDDPALPELAAMIRQPTLAESVARGDDLAREPLRVRILRGSCAISSRSASAPARRVGEPRPQQSLKPGQVADEDRHGLQRQRGNQALQRPGEGDVR